MHVLSMASSELKCFWLGFLLFCGLWIAGLCDQDGKSCAPASLMLVGYTYLYVF